MTTLENDLLLASLKSQLRIKKVELDVYLNVIREIETQISELESKV